MKKIVTLILLILVGLLITLLIGKKYFGSIKRVIKGTETVESVLEKVESSVFERLKSDLDKIGYQTFPTKIKMLAFKDERMLEVYAKQQNQYVLLKKYPFTAYSGKLGPKLKEGDRQIPEGIYHIEHLNPNSSYYLSLKVGYPNAFDNQKAKAEGRTNQGGDIFIHGKAVTIGCIPVGDQAIEEIFVLAKQAYAQGIEIIISPIDFRTGKSFPNIDPITWEAELYSKIQHRIEEILQ